METQSPTPEQLQLLQEKLPLTGRNLGQTLFHRCNLIGPSSVLKSTHLFLKWGRFPENAVSSI